MFSIYRVLKAPFKAKLNTITDQFSGDQSKLELFNQWLELHSSHMIRRFTLLTLKDLIPKHILCLNTSSPSSKVSWHGLIIDQHSLIHSNMFQSFVTYMRTVKCDDFGRLWNFLRDLSLGP
jgi:hypothetical protein